MVSCGFDIINSEWWHFQDVNTLYYLPTDHPIDEIPLVVTEAAQYK
jgi:D-alanyl-D-alanine dipeptidase